MADIDYARVNEVAESYREDMTRFLRALIKNKGTSCEEEAKARLIVAEMDKLGYDRTRIDGLGSAIGYLGTGGKVVCFDGHIDTVGVGNIDNWKFDPFEGMEDDEVIGGRGGSDQLGGVVSAVYGGKVAKDLGLLSDEFTYMVTGTVQEEDCDGMCWLYLIEEENEKPDLVVSTEPTDHGIYRGHRGRMEIRVEVDGVSCHGSAPERGDNAIYKMAEILLEIRDLNDKLHVDEFLGKGTVTTSEIFFTSPSRCAVADSCAISLDRRLTDGETWEGAIEEIKALPSVQKWGARVFCYDYKSTAWTGKEYGQQCYFPTWVIPENSPEVQSAVEAHQGLFGEPRVDKWTFSTNGVATAGRHHIPTIGFGPGKEAQAHAPNELQWKDDLVRCAALYACLPSLYVEHMAASGDAKTLVSQL
ncbi:MAG: YgeY family selenium metabolism-linked hydrolase [Austwickia sp.]|jgi:putative selenium metabolism hydrolase|nr:MAG: YgeY family selenium metabolism-linked hydrolase [Austwickia sp.]